MHIENLKLAPAIAGTLSDTAVHEITLGDVRYIRVDCLATSATPVTLLPPGDTTGYVIANNATTGILPYTAQTLNLKSAAGSSAYLIWRWLP